jgi:hypothetical protein
MEKGILLKDTDFIKDMQQCVIYIKGISEAVDNDNAYAIITLKSAVNYIQSYINDYKKKLK